MRLANRMRVGFPPHGTQGQSLIGSQIRSLVKCGHLSQAASQEHRSQRNVGKMKWSQVMAAIRKAMLIQRAKQTLTLTQTRSRSKMYWGLAHMHFWAFSVALGSIGVHDS